MTHDFKDYIRLEPHRVPAPTEKIVHIIRPDRGIRTFCGLGTSNSVWRVSLDGLDENVNRDVWTVCRDCEQKVAAVPQSSTDR